MSYSEGRFEEKLYDLLFELQSWNRILYVFCRRGLPGNVGCRILNPLAKKVFIST